MGGRCLARARATTTALDASRAFWGARGCGRRGTRGGRSRSCSGGPSGSPPSSATVPTPADIAGRWEERSWGRCSGSAEHDADAAGRRRHRGGGGGGGGRGGGGGGGGAREGGGGPPP